MGEAYEDFLAAGVDVVAVFQYRGEPTRNFCRRRGVSFSCLGDPERELYHAVGLERGGPGEVIGPQLAKGFLRAARRGAFPGIPHGDVNQRPGTFVLDRNGNVAFAHYNRDSSDNVDPSELLRIAREL